MLTILLRMVIMMLMMRVTMMMMTMMNLIMDLTPLLPKICQAAVVAHRINTKRRVHEAAKGWLGLLLRISNAAFLEWGRRRYSFMRNNFMPILMFWAAWCNFKVSVSQRSLAFLGGTCLDNFLDRTLKNTRST